MGPELTGVLAMEKGTGAGAFQDNEMFAFAITDDDLAREKLSEHMIEEGLERVGVFAASGDKVFEERVAFLIGKRVAGSVFQVGHGATKNILPRVIHDPNMVEPSH